jgi:tyrosyl-tRNA synthetase
LVHGEEAVIRARSASEALFGGELGALTKSDLEEIFRDVPTGEINRGRMCRGILLTELLCESGVCSSKGESRRMIEQGAIYVNNVRVNESDRLLSLDDVIADNSVVVRKGKKEYHLLCAVE